MKYLCEFFPSSGIILEHLNVIPNLESRAFVNTVPNAQFHITCNVSELNSCINCTSVVLECTSVVLDCTR